MYMGVTLSFEPLNLELATKKDIAQYAVALSVLCLVLILASISLFQSIHHLVLPLRVLN
jgi:hypothetical protein